MSEVEKVEEEKRENESNTLDHTSVPEVKKVDSSYPTNNDRQIQGEENTNANSNSQDKNIPKKEEKTPPKNASPPTFKKSRTPKPTLPNVLSEYGLEEKRSPKPKRKEHKKKKKRQKSAEDEDDKETLMRQRERDEERHLQVMDDMEKLYKYMHDKYIQKLQQHVVKQRSDIQKKTQAIEEKKRLKDEQNKKELDESRQRHTKKHTLKNDTEFLRNVTKTDIGRIVHLMDQKVKKGELKTQYEIDVFWQKIQDPVVFQQYFKTNKTTESHASAESLTESADQSEKTATDDMFAKLKESNVRALSRLTEGSAESPRTEPAGDWAVTQQVKHQHGHGDSPSGRRNSVTQIAKQAAHDLDKRCPRLEMPKLQCFTMDLSRKLPDISEVTRKEALIERERNRKIFLKKLQKMHQMAMAHSAAANRILASHKNDLFLSLEGSNLEDLFKPSRPEDYSPDEKIFMTETSQTFVGRPASENRSRDERSYTRSSSSSHKSRSSILSTDSSIGQRRIKKFKKRQAMSSSVHLPPLPLTMNDVSTEQAKTVEAKCLSTNWTNYMQAGKSVFAQS